MPLSEWAVSGVVVPFLAAFAVAALARAWTGQGHSLRSVVGTLAIAFGYLAGHVAVAWPAVPPLDVTDRIPWLVALATVLAIAAATIGHVPGLRGLAPILLAVAVVAALFEPVFSRWTRTPEGCVGIAATLVVLLIGLGNVPALGDRGVGVVVGAAWVLTALVVGIALALTGSLTLGRLAIALAAVVAGVWVVDRRAIGSATALVYGAALGALLITGWVYSALPAGAAAVLGLAPAALRWVPLRPRTATARDGSLR